MTKRSSSTHAQGARDPAARGGKRAGGWLLGLFALPFAAVGVGMLLLSVLPTL